MSPKLNRTLIRRHNLDIGSFYFYENYLVAEMKEGVGLDFENASGLLRLAKTYYNNTIPFVYISNRKNSYAFNPTAHYKTGQIFPNLKGFAVVTYDKINTDIAILEQDFLNVPVKISKTLEDAIKWVEELIVID